MWAGVIPCGSSLFGFVQQPKAKSRITEMAAVRLLYLLLKPQPEIRPSPVLQPVGTNIFGVRLLNSAAPSQLHSSISFRFQRWLSSHQVLCSRAGGILAWCRVVDKAGLLEQIESLKNELESAHAALRTVSEVPPEQLDPQVRLWAREVREASYDMEDILDTFLVDGAPADGLGKGRRLLKKMEKLFRKSKERHAIAGAIQKMKGRLQEVADRRDRYAVPVAAPAPVRTLDPRLVYMHREAAQLVGIDKTKAELMAMLLPLSSSRCPEDDVDVSASDGDKMKIVSVVGAGGLGKTTLAKAVYDELKPRYDHGAFVSVGRKPDLVQVFTSIFFHLDEQKYNAIREVKDLQLLAGELRRFLQDKRYTHTKYSKYVHKLPTSTGRC
jgi:hypothetical protein